MLTLEDVAPTATTPQAQTGTVQVPANLQLWNTLPPQVQFTAAEYGTSLLGVPLTDLQKAIQKLPKAIQPAQQTTIQQKLKTLDANRPKAPLPKGPLPNVKGVNRAMRGR